MGLGHVMHVGRCRTYAVYHARLRIHPNVHFHPEVPLVALLRLVHLWVSSTSPILRRRRRFYYARIHYRPFLKTQATRLQMAVDLLEQTLTQIVGVQKMSEVQDPSSRPAAAQTASRPRTV